MAGKREEVLAFRIRCGDCSLKWISDEATPKAWKAAYVAAERHGRVQEHTVRVVKKTAYTLGSPR